jgi:hypothetical protein
MSTKRPPSLTSRKSGQRRPPAKYCDNMQYEPTGVQGVHEAKVHQCTTGGQQSLFVNRTLNPCGSRSIQQCWMK